MCVRGQELCESGGGRPGPVPNSLNATQLHFEEERVCLVGVCFNVGLFLGALFCFFFSVFFFFFFTCGTRNAICMKNLLDLVYDRKRFKYTSLEF